MNCGEILLLNYPFTDDSGAKVRPALVVSAQQFNEGQDVVVVPISATQDPDSPNVFTIRDTDKWYKQTGLRQTSYVRWTKPLTLSKHVAIRRLGHLASEPLSEVRSKIRILFES